MNPTIGREGELEIAPAEVSKKVGVVGGGPAGMEAARICAIRGHQVTLFEQNRLGGVLYEASTPRFKSDIRAFLRYLQTQVEKLNIEVVEVEATPELLLSYGFDAIIIAAGARPVSLQIPGVDKPFVFDGVQVLKNSIKLGKEVVVVGGGFIGAEIALWLDEQGKAVTIVEESGHLMTDCEATNRVALTEKLALSKIKVITGGAVVKINDRGVVVNDGDNQIEIAGDSVVTAVGFKPDRELGEKLKKEADLEILFVSDCVRPGKIFDAIHSANRTARLL